MSISNHRLIEKETIDSIIKVLIEKKGYPENSILIDERIKRGKLTVIPDILITDDSGKRYIGLFEVKTRLTEDTKFRALQQVVSTRNLLNEDIPIFLLTPKPPKFNSFHLTEKGDWVDIDFKEFPSYSDLVRAGKRRSILREGEKQQIEEKRSKLKKFWSSIGISIATFGIIASMLSAILTSNFQIGNKDSIEQYEQELIILKNEIKSQSIGIINFKKLQQDSLYCGIRDLKLMIDTLNSEEKTTIRIVNLEKEVKKESVYQESVIDSLKLKISNLNSYLNYDLEKAFTVKVLDERFKAVDKKIDYELKLQEKEINRIDSNFKILMTLLITVLAAMVASFIPNLKK